MTKKKVSLFDRAHRYASRSRVKNAPKPWTDDMRGSYWWGLFEGYQAGIRAARRKK